MMKMIMMIMKMNIMIIVDMSYNDDRVPSRRARAETWRERGPSDGTDFKLYQT